MKVIALAFLLAVASATPNRLASDFETGVRAGSERLTVGSVVDAIEAVAQAIRDAGLDPIDLPSKNLAYALPVESVFNARGSHHGIHSYGLGNIRVNRMNYAILTSRLTFDVEMPRISLIISDGEWDAICLGGKFKTKASGSIVIRSLRLTGDIRVSIGVITGISIRSMDLQFSLAGIDSHLLVQLQSWDISNYLNDFLGHRVPNALKLHEKDINDLLTMVVREIVEANL